MVGVFFIPFPKPKTQREKCERWLRLCGRKHFTKDNVTKDTCICSKHFVGGNGPTCDHPDPLPAAATEVEVRLISSKKKRKAPTERGTPKKKCRKVLSETYTDEYSPLSETTYLDNEQCYCKPDVSPLVLHVSDDESTDIVQIDEFIVTGGELTSVIGKLHR